MFENIRYVQGHLLCSDIRRFWMYLGVEEKFVTLFVFYVNAGGNVTVLQSYTLIEELHYFTPQGIDE